MNMVFVKKLYLGFVVVLLFALLIPLSVFAGQEKTGVCHLDDDGNYILITIADPAVDNHIAHGDKLAGTNGLDENCAPLRYIDNGDGTVTDTQTGIIWLKNANCFGYQDVPEASYSARTLNSGECSLTDGSMEGDWRLPTKEEWEATVADAITLGCSNPALTDTAGTGCYRDEPAKIFTNINTPISPHYWSGSFPDNTLAYWYVNLGKGELDIIEYTFSYGLLWPVRGGQ